MKIGFLFVHPPNESIGSMTLIRDLCQGLSNFGCECLIFSPYEYPVNWGENIKFYKITSLSNSSFISEKIYKYTRFLLNKPFFARMFVLNPKTIDSLISKLSEGLIKILARENIKLDLIQGEQEIAALALCRIKERLNIPIICHLHNFWPEELVIGKTISKKDKRYSHLIELEKEILANADHVFTPSDFFREFLIKEFNIEPTRISKLFHCGFSRLEAPKERLNPPRVIYSGLVVHRANVELFINAIPHILSKNKNVEFYITNKGELLPKIKKLAKNLNINVNFYWFESFNEYLELLSGCTAAVLPSSDDLPRRFGPASKLYDYLSVGVPVVANDIGSWTEIIQEENVGILTPNDPVEFAKGISRLIETPQLSMEMGERGIELVNTRANWNNVIKNEILPVYTKYVQHDTMESALDAEPSSP